MERSKRKELVDAYLQQKTIMGVIQIRNVQNGKCYIDCYPNLKNKWLTLRMQLNDGRFANAQLQKDWTTLGEQAFEYTELDTKTTDKVTDLRWEIKQMRKQWLEKVQPYGERGYHKETM